MRDVGVLCYAVGALGEVVFDCCAICAAVDEIELLGSLWRLHWPGEYGWLRSIRRSRELFGLRDPQNLDLCTRRVCAEPRIERVHLDRLWVVR